jgi:hypothetical protein
MLYIYNNTHVLEVQCGLRIEIEESKKKVAFYRRRLQCVSVRVLMPFLSYHNAVTVEILSRVAVITGNLDHFIHLHYKVMVTFDLATVKYTENSSSLTPNIQFISVRLSIG